MGASERTISPFSETSQSVCSLASSQPKGEREQLDFIFTFVATVFVHNYYWLSLQTQSFADLLLLQRRIHKVYFFRGCVYEVQEELIMAKIGIN